MKTSRGHLYDSLNLFLRQWYHIWYMTSPIFDAHLLTSTLYWLLLYLHCNLVHSLLQEVSRYKGSNELFQLTTVSYCQISYCRMLDNTIFHLIFHEAETEHNAQFEASNCDISVGKTSQLQILLFFYIRKVGKILEFQLNLSWYCL